MEHLRRLRTSVGLASIALACTLIYVASTNGLSAYAAQQSNENDGAVAATASAGSSAKDGSSSSDAISLEDLDLNAPTGEWVTDELADCGSCHERVAASQTDESCLYSKHANISCFTCHDDNEGLEKAHKHATAKKASRLARLKKTKVSEELCLACHDKDSLIEATKDETGFTDANGTTVNPHDLPAVDDHTENVDCGTCHTFHDSKYTPQQAGMASCLGCHHQNVFECYTCHD